MVKSPAKVKAGVFRSKTRALPDKDGLSVCRLCISSTNDIFRHSSERFIVDSEVKTTSTEIIGRSGCSGLFVCAAGTLSLQLFTCCATFLSSSFCVGKMCCDVLSTVVTQKSISIHVLLGGKKTNNRCLSNPSPIFPLSKMF